MKNISRPQIVRHRRMILLIREWMRTGVFFEPHSGFDIAAVCRDSFGIVRGEKVMRIRLLFSPRVAAYIRERVWHSTQRIVDKRLRS